MFSPASLDYKEAPKRGLSVTVTYAHYRSRMNDVSTWRDISPCTKQWQGERAPIRSCRDAQAAPR